MHPIFASTRQLGLYVLAWLIPTALVVYMLLVSARLTLVEAVALPVPLCVVFAIVCLCPSYTCRVLPLRRTGAVKLMLHHLLAAAVIAFFWTRLAIGLAWLYRGFWPDLPSHV